MAPKVRLLVVDDEESIRDLLSIGLGHRGFDVKTACDAREALAAVGAFAPHAAIVDVMMPGDDGFQLTRRLRQNPNLYILMLTARDAVSDRVQGLDDGADDYLIKPFDFDELVARINAGLRRIHKNETAVSEFANIRMDDVSHRVTADDDLIQLTAKEYELLRYLLLNPGRVLSKTQILQHVWGYDFPGDDNLVEVHISSLREKIHDRAKSTIQTVRGFGYRLGD
jgi:two-component system OmpR family response regulator